MTVIPIEDSVKELQDLLSSLVSQDNLKSMESMAEAMDALKENGLRPREQLSALEDLAILFYVEQTKYSSYVSLIRYYIHKNELWKFETEVVDGETRQKWTRWEEYIESFNRRMQSDDGVRKVYQDNSTLEALEGLGMDIHDMGEVIQHPSKARTALGVAHYHEWN